MDVTTEYLDEFAVQPGEPEEVALSGFEREASATIGGNDEEGIFLNVLWRDGWPSDKPWQVQAGTDKRETFVIPHRGLDRVGDIGYRFSGLIQLADVRAWYRRKNNLADDTGGVVIDIDGVVILDGAVILQGS